MNQFFSKLKLIFVPFVAVTVLFITAYTFFNWFIFVKLSLFVVDDVFTEIAGPGVIALVIILLWVKPRLKLLNMVSNRRSDPLSFALLITYIGMLGPCIIAQTYMESATGKLTVLDHISSLNHLPLTKYYEVKHFYTDKRFARFKVTFKVSGKHNNNFDMGIYAVSPVLDSAFTQPDTAGKMLNPKGNFKNPFVLLNGKPIAGQQLKKIDPDKVETVNVLHGNAAISIYGDKGKNGVLLISLKKQYKVEDILAEITDPPVPAFITPPVAWLTTSYSKTISNRLSDSEKQAEYKAFADESQRDFDAKNLNEFVYLERLGPSSMRDNYIAAVRTKDSLTRAYPVILSPVNEPFAARNGNKLFWVFGILGICCAILLMIIAYWPLNVDAEPVPQKSTDPFGLKIIRNLVVPRQGFFSTAIIIDLNLLLFIIMVCSGLGFINFNAHDLLVWGGNFRPSVQTGQYWRLLTNMFLHGGIMHVLFNMYGLLFVGIFLEPLLGTGKYTVLYLLTGIIASITSIWWHPATVSVGASGAIFGMYGVFLALLTTNLFPPEFKKPFLINTAVFVGYNLLAGLSGGIDNAAHIGGLLSGLLFGYALYPSLKQKARQAEAEQETVQMLDELAGKDQG
ncbi:rhomboid family intramembrane serine protease [Mucilaginibacter sp. Mucisp86]|uniref:rhomboid family intramembrane serine protease n=1 Tax=Mucilaginibacter sp. Mucisp86 TaxID=3243060 RepID=UPI0039B569D1